jgi:hypothetical protein
MFSFRQQPSAFTILKDGLPVMVQNGSPDARPYVHPIWAPDGIGVVTQDAPPTHPWQHGLYFGLNKVNGVGFWTEGLRPQSQASDGRVVATRLVPLEAGRAASWNTEASWRGISGEELLTDSVTWSIASDRESYWMDATWQLIAKVDIEFGKHAYGGMFLRMPVEDGADPQILSSNGATSPEGAEGQRARWLAVAASLPERSSLHDDRRHVCVTLMDHPSNPEHPVPWRADSKYGIGPSRCVIGPWRLNAGQSATFRHRVLVTIGIPHAETIESSYHLFSEATPCQLQL